MSDIEIETHKIVAIGFSRPKKWKVFSWLIMAVERTNYSHSFVTWKDENIQRRKIFEAVGAGVRIIGNILFKQKAEITEIYNFKVSEEVVIWLEQYAHDQSGKPYGYKHVIGLLLMRIYSAFGFKIANPFKDGDYSQICVEAGAYVLEKGLGVDLPGNVEDYGLREYRALVAKYGDALPCEKIEAINGRV